MKSIFNTQAYEEVLKRIDKLKPESNPQWGKMDVAKMLWHCQGPINVALQKNDYQMKPMSFLLRLWIKKSLYNDKPWRKGLPTAKKLKTTNPKDFEKEKQALIALISQLHQHKDKKDWASHPVFGKLNPSQWGKMQYKHLDHHLRQFGA